MAERKHAPESEVHPKLARELLCPEFCSGVSLTLLASRAVSEDSGLPTPTVPPAGHGRQSHVLDCKPTFHPLKYWRGSQQACGP